MLFRNFLKSSFNSKFAVKNIISTFKSNVLQLPCQFQNSQFSNCFCFHSTYVDTLDGAIHQKIYPSASFNIRGNCQITPFLTFHNLRRLYLDKRFAFGLKSAPLLRFTKFITKTFLYNFLLLCNGKNIDFSDLANLGVDLNFGFGLV